MAENNALYAKGLFENNQDGGATSPEAHPLTYKMTPKYRDPFAKDADRKLAKFLISSKLLRAIREAKGGREDPLLSKLGQERGYFDFFLQSVDEVFDEKFQVMETLGDSYAVFGLGKKPRILNCSGALLNSVENDWRLRFIKIFEEYLSISSLARFRQTAVNNIATFVYDSVTVSGALLSLRTSLRGENELVCPFVFSMLVTSSTTFNLSEISIPLTQSTVPSGAITDETIEFIGPPRPPSLGELPPTISNATNDQNVTASNAATTQNDSNTTAGRANSAAPDPNEPSTKKTAAERLAADDEARRGGYSRVEGG